MSDFDIVREALGWLDEHALEALDRIETGNEKLRTAPERWKSEQVNKVERENFKLHREVHWLGHELDQMREALKAIEADTTRAIKVYEEYGGFLALNEPLIVVQRLARKGLRPLWEAQP